MTGGLHPTGMLAHLGALLGGGFHLVGVAHADQQQSRAGNPPPGGRTGAGRCRHPAPGGSRPGHRPRLRFCSASTRPTTSWLVAVPSTVWAVARVMCSPVEASWSSSEMASRMAAGRLAGDQHQGFVVHFDLLGCCHLSQVVDDIHHRDAAEFVALAAREHRGRDLVHFGGRQDENGVRRAVLPASSAAH